MSNSLNDIVGDNWKSADEKPRSFSPLPAGAYATAVKKATIKDTRSGGRGINFQLEVIDGEHEGRQLFAFINVVNPNKTCQDIGRQQLGELTQVCDLTEESQLDDFIGCEQISHVKIDKDDDTRNVVTGFERIDNTPKPDTPPASSPAATRPSFLPKK